MSRSRLAAPLLAAALVLAVAGCGGDGSTGEGEAAEGPTDELVFADELQGLARDPALQVGDVVLPVAGTGAAHEMRAAPGELLVAYFGYLSCPDVCPTSMSDLEKALSQVGEGADRVEVSFTTVDPDRDTPQLMADYLGFFFDRWLALRTEDPAQLAAAEDAFLASSSVTTTPEGVVEVEHSAQLYVIDDRGEVLVEWPFGTSSDVMASDLRLLLDQQAAAAEGGATT